VTISAQQQADIQRLSETLQGLVGQQLTGAEIGYHLMLHLDFGRYWLGAEDSSWKLLDPDGEVLAELIDEELVGDEEILGSFRQLIGTSVRSVSQPSLTALSVELESGHRLELHAPSDAEVCWAITTPERLWLSGRPDRVLLLRSDQPIAEAEAEPLARVPRALHTRER
jgi:hypothetical protein